jgi:hypothetical protein
VLVGERAGRGVNVDHGHSEVLPSRLRASAWCGARE